MNKPHSKLGMTEGLDLVACLPPVVWAAILFGLSSIPGSQLPSVAISLGDKIGHAFVYSILGFLVLRALRRTTAWGPATGVIAAVLVTLAFGISDEIHQMFVPMRSSELLDVVADFVGGSLGTLGGHLTGRFPAAPRRKT